MSWSCKKCRATIDDEFDACWQCGTSVDGSENENFLTEVDISGQAPLPQATPAERKKRPAEHESDIRASLGWIGCYGILLLPLAGLLCLSSFLMGGDLYPLSAAVCVVVLPPMWKRYGGLGVALMLALLILLFSGAAHAILRARSEQDLAATVVVIVLIAGAAFWTVIRLSRSVVTSRATKNRRLLKRERGR